MNDESALFRSKPQNLVPRGQEQQAVDASPSPLSGASTPAPAPIWESFVTNTVALRNNREVVAQERQRQRESMAQSGEGDIFKGADGKLIHKRRGMPGQVLEAEDFVDHPVAGAEARRALWDREIRTKKREADDITFQLQDPKFHAKGLAPKDREAILAEGEFLQETNPRHAELKAKLIADDEYRTAKMDLGQKAWDAKNRARQLEETDPELWWQERQAQPVDPVQQRQATVQEAQAQRQEAATADQAAQARDAELVAKMQRGLSADEMAQAQAERKRIAEHRGQIAEFAADHDRTIAGVAEEAKQQLAPPAHPEQRGVGDFLRGAQVSISQLPQLGYGVAALIGSTAEKVTGYGKSLQDWGLQGYKDSEVHAQPLQRENDDVTKAWEKAKGGDIGALVDWAQYGLGYALGQIGETVAIGALGGAAGAAATAETGPGAAVGGAAGGVIAAIGKGAFKEAVKTMVEKAVTKQALALATDEAAKIAAKSGTKLSTEMIAKRAATGELRKAAGKSLGSNIAVMSQALGMELGSIYPEAEKQAAAEGRQLSGTDLARVWATGIAAGGIEGLTDKLGLDILKGKFSDALPKGRLAAAAVASVGDAAMEGGTEVVQTGLERLGARQSVTDAEAQSDYINSGAMGALGGAAVGGAGGAWNFKKDGPEAKSVVDHVNTGLQAIDPEAQPASVDEVHNASFFARDNDGPEGMAEIVLINRELAAIEEQDAGILPAAQEALTLAQQSGDKGAVAAAETQLEQAGAQVNRAHLTRAAIKIAAGKGLDQLTADELTAVGYESKPSKSGEITFVPAKVQGVKQGANTPVAPMIRQGADGSIILTDTALKKVGEVSTRARDRVKMSESEAIQAAIDRQAQALTTPDASGQANAENLAGASAPASQQQVSADPSEAKVNGFSEASGGVAEFDVPMRDGTVLRVQAPDATAALDEAAAQGPITGAPAAPVQPPSAGVSNGGQREAGTGFSATGVEVSPSETVAPAEDSTPTNDEQPTNGNDRSGTDDALNDEARGKKRERSKASAEEKPQAGQDSPESKPLTPAAGPDKVKVTVAKARALVAKAKTSKALKDRLIETEERAATRPDGITINPELIVTEALDLGMTEAQAVEYFGRILDEEIRHLAQYDAAKILFQMTGSKGDFLAWMENHYAAIWESDFAGTDKEAIVRTLYTNDEKSTLAEWDAMTPGNKALEAIRMMSQGQNVTEAAKLWANISGSLRNALRVALTALKKFADVASPTILQEITNLENALAKLTGAPTKGPTNAGNPQQKPDRDSPNAGNAGTSEKGSSGATPESGQAEPPRRDAPFPSAFVGKRVEFDRNGELLTGVVTWEKGDAVRVKLDRPDAEGVPTRAVNKDTLRVLEVPDRQPAPDHSWNAEKQANYKSLKRALMRAQNAGEWQKVIQLAESALAIFEKTGYPDDWTLWERARDDAQMRLAHGPKEGKTLEKDKPSSDIDKAAKLYSAWHQTRIRKDAEKQDFVRDNLEKILAEWSPENVLAKVEEYLADIDSKNIDKLDGYNNGQFEIFWKLFAWRTGIKVPASQTAKDAMLREFVGDGAYAARQEKVKAARAKAAEESATKDEEYRIKRLRQDAQSINVNHSGKLMNGREFADLMLAEGWRIENISDGPVPRYTFKKGDRILKNVKGMKEVASYAREAQKDLPEIEDTSIAAEDAAFEALPQENKDAIDNLFKPGGTTAKKPVATEDKPKISDADHAALDLMKDIIPGLEAAPLTDANAYKKALPPEKIAGLISVAQKYIAEGVTTPEAFAERFNTLADGKLKPYTQSFWGAFVIVDPSVDAAPDWNTIYTALESPEVNEKATGDSTPAFRLAQQILGRIKRREKISIQQLTQMATSEFGGSTGDNFDIKTAYDAVEMAINMLVQQSGIKVNVDAETALKNIETIRSWMEYIPTQTRRTGEMDALQQFSTPPHFAYAAAWVAAIQKGQAALEPSAGLGSMAVWMEKAGAEVWLNEISPRRREMLDTLDIGDPATGHDAGMIHAITAPAIKSGKIRQPEVVVMNPPFSNNAVSGRKDLLTGGKHIEEALKMLKPGGRLVAIVGEGMALEAPSYKPWWDKIRKSYTVRANIHMDGSEYRKYGTTFSNRILVIDKEIPANERIVQGEVKTIEDLIPLLDPIRQDHGNETTNQTGGVESSAQPDSTRQDQEGGTDAADVSGSPDTVTGTPRTDQGGKRGQRGGRGTGSTRTKADGPGDKTTRGSDQPAGSDVDPAGRNSGQGDGRTEGSTGVELSTEADTKREVDADQVFSEYKPTKFRVKGAQPHPNTLVESSVMANTELPDIKVVPNLPKETIEKGELSDAQLEAIALAKRAHQTLFDDGTRQGFFIGDGTGVGKGREIAGTILDNWRDGRKKAVWISEKKGLIADARRDLKGVGGQDIPIHSMVTKTGPPEGEGMAFLTYDGLRGNFNGVEEDGTPRASEKVSRIASLMEWLGRDFDGVIALDEVHNLGNVIPIKGTRGFSQPSKKAQAGVDLQKVFPKARILYVSATGATEPNNLAFASRLGMWGVGKAFKSPEDFYNQIKSAGLSAMEIVARDLKTLGLYIARALSFKGVSFDRLEHQLTDDQEAIYSKAAEGWQVIFQNLEAALDATGAGNSSDARSRSASAFWSGQQRFFNNLLTALQMPTALADMRAKLANGGSVVIQLVNTNEAALDRAIDRALAENPDNPDYENVDLSTRQDMLEYIHQSFPVLQFHEVADGQYSNGDPKTKWVPLYVKDADGNDVPVLNPQAIEARDKLLEEIATLKLPDPPMEQLFNAFGHDAIAEITGRSRRLVRKEIDGSERRVLETGRGEPRVKKEKDDFLAGDRRILIFSDAGGTGFSYHAGANFKNQQKRFQYVVQAGWRADKAIQGLGRTHRADQVKTPAFILVSTNVNGHKRFISTIARRLQQLGALTSGERKTTGQGLFNEDDNLEDDYAELGVKRFFNDLFAGRIEGLNFHDVSRRMGFVKIKDEAEVNKLVDESGALNREALPELKQFLNRMLALPIKEQNAVFEAFVDRRANFVEQAKENGTYDAGVETFKVADPKIGYDEEVYSDPNSTARTRLVEIQYKRYLPLNSFDDVAALARDPKFVISRDKKKIFGLGAVNTTSTHEDGTVEPNYRRFAIKGVTTVPQSDYTTGEAPGYAKPGDKFEVDGVEYQFVSTEKWGDTTRAKIRRVSATGQTTPIVAQAPHLKALYETTGNIIEGVNDNSRYVPKYHALTEEEARAEWDRLLEEEPKYEEKAETFIVGSSLPIWHRIPFMFKQVKRVLMPDGNDFLGIEVRDKDVDKTRNNLGAAQAEITPGRALDALVGRKAEIELSNGWRVKVTNSAGEQRLEVIGLPESWVRGSYPNWDRYGFVEKINWVPRAFMLPTLKNLDNLFRFVPASRVIESLKASELPAAAVETQPLRAGSLPAVAPFYSQLEKAIEAKMPAKADPSQVLAIAKAGSKMEEIKWSGLIPKLQSLAADNGGKVDKAALLDYLGTEGRVQFEEVVSGGKSNENRYESRSRDYDGFEGAGVWDTHNNEWQNEDSMTELEAESKAENLNSFAPTATKFGQYVLPGGENYREVVLAMPNGGFDEWLKRRGVSELKNETSEKSLALIQEFSREKGLGYTSSHFPDVPNYVAHMRLNERDGGLFIEEIQSDRHQAGRKMGYRPKQGTATEEDARQVFGMTKEVWSDFTEDEKKSYMDELDSGEKYLVGLTADAPYRKDWPLAMFKRALRDAVAGGKHWIGWTTGETQNSRFDLSKQVRSIVWSPYERRGSSKLVTIEPNEGNTIELPVTDAGMVIEGIGTQFDGKRLDDVVGKDIAEKILNEKRGDLSGDGLKVGGTGMKGFYDQILPKEVGKYVRQWGGKVEQATVSAVVPKRETRGSVTSEEFVMGQKPEELPIWRVTITPEMKKGVSTGQALYAAPLPKHEADPGPVFRYKVPVNKALAEEAQAEREAFGQNVASGKLAGFGDEKSRAEQDVVDAIYEFNKAVKTNADTMAIARQRLAADPLDIDAKLLDAVTDKVFALDAADHLAMQLRINQRSAEAGNDVTKQAEVMSMRMAYRLMRGDAARTLQIGYDRNLTPAERAQAAIVDAIYTPSRKVEKQAMGISISQRAAFFRQAAEERIKVVEAELKKMGVTLAQATGKAQKLELANSQLMKDVLALRKRLDQDVLKMVQAGHTAADIKRRYGLRQEETQAIVTAARDELKAKIAPMVQAGMSMAEIVAKIGSLSAAKLKAGPLKAMTPAEIEAEVEKIIVLGFGLPKDVPTAALPRPRVPKAPPAPVDPVLADWSRPEFTDGLASFTFNTKDRAAIMSRVESIRAVAGALGKIEGLTGTKRDEAMVKLAQLEAILAKYGTDAKSIFEAGRPIEDYRFNPSDINHVSAIARAISAIDADLIDKASEVLYANMLSGLQTMAVNATAIIPAAWETTVGRGMELAVNSFVRDPMAAQWGETKYILKAIRPALTRAMSNFSASFQAQHPMFDRDVLNHEVDWDKILGGAGYRVGGSISGRKGDIIRIPMRLLASTDDFNRTLMACVEVGCFAYRLAKAQGLKPGTPEFDRFLRIQVNKPGSAAYELAAQKASRAIFSNALPGQKDGTTGKKVEVNDLGDMAGWAAASLNKFVSQEHDNQFAKAALAALRICFFPFQRTPFNILRRGIRYTLNPFSIFDIALGAVLNSKATDADGKTKWKWNAQGRNPELIERVGQQLQGAILMMALAAIGAGEGDDDDQKKGLLITGSAPFTPAGRSEREAQARSGIPGYRISFRNSDGSERFGFSYGRLEPLATTLAASIDLMKSVKRADRQGKGAYDAASEALGGLVAQAQDKSFMRGVNDLVALITNTMAEPDLRENRKFQQFLAGRVAMVIPNIIKQPLREADSVYRERSADFLQELLYQVAPIGQKEAKITPYGEIAEKTGTPVTRVFDVTDAGTDKVHPVDRMLLKWRDSGKWSKAPDERDRKPWFPAPIVHADFKNPRTGQQQKMTEPQLAEFREKAGKRTAALLKTKSLNYENPTITDIEKVKDSVETARREMKAALAFKFSAPAAK